jgi:hypothetical protein
MLSIIPVMEYNTEEFDCDQEWNAVPLSSAENKETLQNYTNVNNEHKQWSTAEYIIATN